TQAQTPSTSGSHFYARYPAAWAALSLNNPRPARAVNAEGVWFSTTDAKALAVASYANLPVRRVALTPLHLHALLYSRVVQQAKGFALDMPGSPTRLVRGYEHTLYRVEDKVVVALTLETEVA